MSADPAVRQDLAWQQLGLLRREAERQERLPNSATVFGLPGLTEPELTRRLTELVSQQDSLRLAAVCGRDGGSAIYADYLAPPVHTIAAGSVEEARSIAMELVDRPFSRDAGPLWELCIIDHPDLAGQPCRTACAAFDRLITDGRSLFVFQQALLADGGSTARAGRFRDWVSWQRRRFPVGRTETATPEREFWLKYLDGTQPDRPTPLPFWSEGPISDAGEIIHQDLPGDAAVLAAAARRLQTTPFSLFLATIAAAVSAVSGAGDITLRVHVTGRRPGYLDTLGPFGETLPIRFCHPALSDPRAALAAARDAWIATLPYQATPWDYIRAICAGDDVPSVSYRPPQVMVNFVPWAAAPLHWQFYEAQTRVQVRVATLQLSAAVRADSSYHLSCLFDPGRYAAAGVRQFLDLIDRNLRRYFTG